MCLSNVVQEKLLVSGFWAHRYPVECLAVSGERLVTGAHSEIAVWKWSSAESKYKREIDLDEPPKTSQNESQPILVTSLHWTSSEKHPCLLFITYMNHGIQWVFKERISFLSAYAVLRLLNAADWTSLRAVALNGRLERRLRSDSASALVEEVPAWRQTTGEPYPVPILFIHGGRALMGGSTVGEVDIWAVDLQRKMHSLPLHHHKKVLAIAAHYSEDIHRLFIATGIFNESGHSDCVIWSAQSLGPSTTSETDSQAASQADGSSYALSSQEGGSPDGGWTEYINYRWFVAVIALFVFGRMLSSMGEDL
ncbi:hypothetical protein C8Q79DRAFT_924090 [Trametes meyenii]|nr:hypothetical protein C8Q79DRAFT_924090 [Trametes meyenii]